MAPRGGKRERAGRPRSYKLPEEQNIISFTVSEPLKCALDKFVREFGSGNRSEVIRNAINHYIYGGKN